MTMPVVAVPADIRHFDGYDWHAAPHQYLAAAFGGSGVIPLIVPAIEGGLDVGSVLDRVDGLLVTGSKTNVHPTLYGVAESPSYGPFDTARDTVSLALIREAIARGLPLLAICRGIQELNVALGGTLANEIQMLPERMDHRKPESDDTDESFAIRHPVRIAEGSCLAAMVGTGEINVNSLHRQGIDQLAPGLAVEAVAEDGTIEAVSVADAKGFAVGVQWHPEYWFRSDAPSAAIFRGFGDAVRSRVERRQSDHNGRAAAE
ncbi:gamma-glutamyl-gamma-aminobutyrate hydrolase family protein [Pararhizobium haloflavum]|uniref:gamma-glutamyl-gamma-aminobutyrate hydrolase family protein n=1 Tax=Pararhizobium haloflavum TaxID=2037914 RepID=UPI000C199E97|nr:gamma-glutamyl-gamma-aminobutyrate hydrolase family protein [Pararhizobium haloflavum]